MHVVNDEAAEPSITIANRLGRMSAPDEIAPPAPVSLNSCGCWAVVVVVTQAPSIIAAMAAKIGVRTESARVINRAPETHKTRKTCAGQKHE